MIYIAFCSLFFSCQHTDVQPADIAPTKLGSNIGSIFDFQADLARPSNNCLSGWGFCNAHLVIFGWFPVFKSTNGNLTPFSGYVEPVEGAAANVKNLVFQFANPNDVTVLGDNDGKRIVEIHDALDINSDTAHSMGYSSMIMQPGNYAFDSSLGDNGGFKVRVVVE